MDLPFTLTQFLEVFKTYNTSVFPIQIFFNILAIIAIYILVRRKGNAGAIVSAMLALLWLWMGVVYHILFFSTINDAAYVFGALYIVQAVFFVWYGILTGKIQFEYRRNSEGIVGWVLVVFALIVYPLIGYVAGHVYPSSPTFGLPCPTTIFTFGLLLWTRNRLSLTVTIIPFIWSLVGFSAAFKLGMHEDIGLLIAGVSAMALILRRNKRKLAAISPA